MTCLIFLGHGRLSVRWDGHSECVQPPATPFSGGRVCLVLFVLAALSHAGRSRGRTLSRVWAALGDRGRAFTTWARNGPRRLFGCLPWHSTPKNDTRNERALPSTAFVLLSGSTAEPTIDAHGPRPFPSSFARCSLCSLGWPCVFTRAQEEEAPQLKKRGLLLVRGLPPRTSKGGCVERLADPNFGRRKQLCHPP